MDTSTAMQKLYERWAEGKHVCLGLDTDVTKMPTCFDVADGQYLFNLNIIGATYDIVAAYKLNLAFYLSQGVRGLQALIDTVKFIRNVAPDVLIILDAKFGDIGNTNDHYGQFAFDIVNADALTIHSYLGYVANKPFLDHADKLFFVLVHTSNDGADEFQELPVTAPDGSQMPLWQYVAIHLFGDAWADNGNVAAVMGATYPEQLGQLRQICPSGELLIPGIGAQGGELEASVVHAHTHNGGFLINSSRQIIFAGDRNDDHEKYFAAVRQACDELDTDIRAILTATCSQPEGESQ